MNNNTIKGIFLLAFLILLGVGWINSSDARKYGPNSEMSGLNTTVPDMSIGETTYDKRAQYCEYLEGMIYLMPEEKREAINVYIDFDSNNDLVVSVDQYDWFGYYDENDRERIKQCLISQLKLEQDNFGTEYISGKGKIQIGSEYVETF